MSNVEKGEAGKTITGGGLLLLIAAGIGGGANLFIGSGELRTAVWLMFLPGLLLVIGGVLQTAGMFDE